MPSPLLVPQVEVVAFIVEVQDTDDHLELSQKLMAFSTADGSTCRPPPVFRWQSSTCHFSALSFSPRFSTALLTYRGLTLSAFATSAHDDFMSGLTVASNTPSHTVCRSLFTLPPAFDPSLDNAVLTLVTTPDSPGRLW
eukprot:806222-Prorocentrum_minimum.AAC.1